jgi:hypothetical protein
MTLEEAVEHPVAVLARDTRPVVRHLDHDEVALDEAGDADDAARMGEPQGVLDQRIQ